MIHISLSPNLEPDDLLLCLKQIVNFKKWSETGCQDKLKKILFLHFPKAQEILLFNSGRSALMTGLKCLDLPENSEILLQAYTCSVVPNSILWNKYQPKYVDINEGSYNLDEKLLPEKTKAKALIVQHTFGQSAEMEKITDYCGKNNLYLIEDCAHSLGAKYKGKETGNFGDITILSFGRDKIVSCVFGGALIINNPKIVDNARKIYNNIAYPPFWWTLQQLLHPPVTFLAKKTYQFGLGKIMLAVAQKTQIISKAVYPQERYHLTAPFFPSRLPESLAALAINQLNKLEKFNKRRAEIALFYEKNLKNTLIKKPTFSTEGIYLRYTIKVSSPEKLRNYLKKHGVFTDKNQWYFQPTTPSENQNAARYKIGQCPIAEKVCQQSFNLPTCPTMSLKEAKMVVDLINKWQP